MTFNLVLLGLMLAIIYYEITNLSPGGLIVPGVLALFYNQPERIVFTIIIAILTYLIVKQMSKYLVIFGKRRFVVLIIVGLFLGFIFEVILALITKSFSASTLNFSLIGYTITGLIASDFYKQGLKKTLPSLIIVTSLTILIGLLLVRVIV